ncbi:hypothetical protein RCH06_002799 [Polaromonas sp. CG_9.5]|uniref:FFLEELY motif protein n=1 Tax=Polaromonas sp. CG_9.5 TaxID=3071705 RepID=UPI002DFE5354|nr:hypothetical protein [Polaromonas sp. CG_9.5]
MDSTAQKIQDALQVVSQFRQQHASDPALAQASTEIKRFQARRFEATYADLLHNPRYQAAASFFLHELYSDKDYAQRDQQFGRIANTIARLFPQAVVNTTGALAEVHALTETLDDKMARCWMADASAAPQDNECDRYIRCWRRLGDRAARHHQLEVVLQLGQEMDRLTRMRGLRTLLKMMRRPAATAGLKSLQQFLETGFDAFVQMKGADEFLKKVQQRESAWIGALFDDDAVTCRTKLANLLATGATH